MDGPSLRVHDFTPNGHKGYHQMEGNDGDADGGGRGGGGEEWWWAASFAQLAWGIYSFRKGYSGDSRLMPLKAFSVASLFLGSTATAGVGTLRSSGIHSLTALRPISFCLALKEYKDYNLSI
ncbi:hypothetical protein RJ640_014584 [Escallonia rubra]|uniref:Uncharacterized protein n=1 Tax=Escallonia rubra TaxID=112253 RepID=A0AA88UGX9_9ASTE|nr:hypothetical protein RJ640_014584 [Escallonia rubra]